MNIFKKIQQKTQRGFTLLELLIYIAILSGFLIVVVNLFLAVSTSSSREEARAEVQQNLRFAVQQITDDMRSASAIILPAGGGSGNTLELTVDAASTVYSIDNGVLQKTRNSVTENITSGNVTVSITNPIFVRSFNAGARPTVQISLEISYKDNGRSEYSFADKLQTTISGNELPVDVVVAPSQVAGLTISIGDAQAVLGWEEPANGGSAITSYKVYRSTASSAEVLLDTGGCASLGNVLTCTDTGLINGTSYFYKVSAVNGVGEGSQSAEVSVIPSL